ncbi:putative ABC transporter permease [Miniphocaeibacter massiliensis]|uniref:putative ABC transporter permease n=1 Tax=Miniphocaeibacter massiliensis TaxID=2041841 RepID=UPI000C1BE8DD|nr:hypothetical protein [Miniphocaeibacter massiliensis]
MTNLFMTFIVYAFIGWIWETIYCSIKAKHFVYRGFLLGPYCPVYGFGVSFVLLLVPKDSGTLLNLYFNVIVIVTIIEYIASFLLEKLFHMKLWDYSDIPFNIEGRVAVPVSLFWGVGCIFLIKVINPVVNDVIDKFIKDTDSIGPIILFILFAVDVMSTLYFSMTTKAEVEKVIDNSDKENAGIKEYRLKHLLANHNSSSSRENVLNHLSNLHKKLKHHSLSRIVKNYPNMKFTKKINNKNNTKN